MITKTIESVLNQTFKDFEIIVIDDKSTDNTFDVVKPYIDKGLIRYYCNEVNSERAISRNRGIDEAKGKYISLLDSDDIFYPGCLEAANDFLSRHPGSRFFHNKYVIINEKDEVISKQRYPTSGNTYKDIMRGNYISNIGFFLDADIARKLRVDENPIFRGVEDYDFIIRAIAECGGAQMIDRYDCAVLMHPQRSVFTDDGEFIYTRTMAFIQKQLSADYVKQHYWPYRQYLVSHLYLYLVSSFAIRGKTARATGFLFKAFKSKPALLFSGGFWKHLLVIAKYSLGKKPV
jgi:glycosyltransferase involved in cell wall biosynthesis